MVTPPTLGVANSHGVTGGVYKITLNYKYQGVYPDDISARLKSTADPQLCSN